MASEFINHILLHLSIATYSIIYTRSQLLSGMVKGGRSYIPVTQNKNSYRVFLADVKTWRQVIKKSTPRLPAYDEVPSMKWE